MADRGGRFARATAAGFTLLVLAFVLAPAALAHAVFVSADPAPGATLRSPPPSVRMVFSEPLNGSLSGIDVYSSAGRPVRLGRARVEPGSPRAFEVALPGLRPDRYTVVWHTVSAIDGHTRRGSYTFTLDRPDGSAPRIQHAAVVGPRSPPQVPTSAQAAATWVGLAGLFLAAGAVLVRMLGTGLGLAAAPRVRRWTGRLLVAGAGCLAAGELGELISAWAPAGWNAASLAGLLASSVGHWWEIRLGAVAALVALWSRPWWSRHTSVHYLQAIAVGVVVLSFAASGHGAASALPTVGLLFEFAHVLAAGVWLGGAIAVAVIWRVTRRDEPADRRALLHRYSLVAGVAVPLVLASGLGNAVLEVGATGDLVSSSYGVSLFVKLLAVSVLLAIAAANAFLLRPAEEGGRPRGRLLRRTIAVEAAVGLAVLVPTAVMGVLAPSRPTDQARAAAQRIQANADPAHAFTGSTQLQGRDAEITLTPGAVGVNAVRIEVEGVYSASRLGLSLTGPGEAADTDLPRTGHDHDAGTHTIYQGALRLTQAGTWQAVLRRSGATGTSPPVVMPVSAPIAGFSEPASSAGLARWLWLIALGGLGLTVAAATRTVPGTRRRVGTLALGAAGVTVALSWAGTLAFPAAGSGRPSASLTSPTAPTAPTAPTGRTVHPQQLPEATMWRIPTPGAGLMTPAIAPDGSVWVAEMDANKLARLDPRGNRIQEYRFPGGYRETMGIAAAPSGRIWLAQEHAMALGRFDPDTGHYREFHIPGGVSAPVGIAVARSGDVWFTEMSGNEIGRFDPGTGRFTRYPIPTPHSTPYWLAVAPDGRIWFTEFEAGQVGRLDPATGHIREFAVPGGATIPGIAVGHDGTVWFSSLQGTLFRLDPSTGRLTRTRLSAGGDYGVAVAPNGTVWVGRQGGRTVDAVDPASGVRRSVRLPPGSAPWWPAAGPDGRIWVALAADAGNGLALLDAPP